MRLRAVVPGWSLVALVAALATGCQATTPGTQGCTEIGAQAGVSVVVEKEVVADSLTLRLRICQTECVEQTVELQPGSTTVDEECTSADPDGSCSASSSPDGTLVGFVGVMPFDPGPVKISGTLRTGSGTTTLGQMTVTAETTYPNGPSCPGEAAQASVRVKPTGLR